MNVAFVTPFPVPGSAPVGGVEVAATRLAPALHRLGISVTVVGLTGAGDTVESSVPVRRLDSDERLAVSRGLRSLQTRLAETLTSIAPDLVHGHSLVPAGYAATRVVRGAKPVVITVQGNRRQDTMAAYSGLGAHARWLLARRMIVGAARRADAIVGVNPDWRVILPEDPGRRYRYVPNIVQDVFFREEPRREDGRVLFCGGLRRIKGWDILLDAWPLVVKRVPYARLHAPGCGVALASTPSAIRASIETGPYLSSDELAAAMRRASVVVLPSRYEAGPIAMSEAWASGVPVVAHAVGGVPAFAEGAARLVPRPDPTLLAEAITEVLIGTPLTPGRVAEGRRRADAQRADKVAAAHLELYEALLAGPRHSVE